MRAARQLAIYGTLLCVGCFFIFIGLSGAFGKVFESLALIAGTCFVGTTLYGLASRRTVKQLPIAAKVLLGIGTLALLAFIVLMAGIVIALRNFT